MKKDIAFRKPHKRKIAYKKSKEGFDLVFISGKGSPIHDHIVEFTS